MKKEYIHIGIAAIVLIVAVVVYAIWYGKVTSESEQVGQIEQQIKDRSQAATRIANTKSQLIALAPEESEVNQYFISANDVVTFLEQLAATGKYLGTDVQVVSVSAVSGNPHGTLNLSLTITGPFDAVMRTLGSIEFGPYDTRTVSVNLNSNSGSSGSAKNSGTWVASAVFAIGMQGTTQTAAATATQQTSVQTQATSATATTTKAKPASATTGSTLLP